MSLPQAQSMGRLPAWVALVTVFIAPEACLMVGLVPYEYRHGLLLISLSAMFIFQAVCKLSFADLGVRYISKDVSHIIAPTLIITAIVYVSLAVIPAWCGAPRTLVKNPLVYLVLIVATPFQELLCRGFAFQVLEALLPKKFFVVVISALLFGLMHLHFHSVLVVLVTTAMGLHWGYHYDRHRSILGVSLAHVFTASIFVMHSYMAPGTAWRLY